MAKDQESQSTEVATITPQAAELMQQLDIRIADPNELAVIVAQRLALAETPEQLDDIVQGTSWEEHMDEPYLIKRVWFPQSTYDSGLPVYALCEAVHAESSEQAVLTTGSIGAVIAIARRAQRGWFDKPVKLTKADKPTANGFYPYRLVQA